MPKVGRLVCRCVMSIASCRSDSCPRNRLMTNPGGGGGGGAGGDERPLPFGKDLHRTDERGEDTPPVDVADKQDGGCRIAGHGHIDDIVGLEVHFGRASRAFQHDGVVFPGQGIEGPLRRVKGLGFVTDIGIHVHIPDGLPQDDHLRTRIAVRFQEDGIHAHIRIDASGLGLNDLGPAHLTAVVRHVRIERHVLGLEGRHPVAVLKQDAAQGGRKDALARIGARSLEHDGGNPAPDGGPARLSEDFRQGIDQPFVLFPRPDGNPEETTV